MCHWANDKINPSDFDWIRNTGNTPSSSTGPNNDHTTGTGKKENWQETRRTFFFFSFFVFERGAGAGFPLPPSPSAVTPYTIGRSGSLSKDDGNGNDDARKQLSDWLNEEK